MQELAYLSLVMLEQAFVLVLVELLQLVLMVDAQAQMVLVYSSALLEVLVCLLGLLV
jgi:hypothetical protein